MGMGFAPTWLRQVSPLLHMTTLTTDYVRGVDREGAVFIDNKLSHISKANKRTNNYYCISGRFAIV